MGYEMNLMSHNQPKKKKERKKKETINRKYHKDALHINSGNIIL